MSVEKENSVSKSKGLMDWAEDLYPLLDMFLGLDDRLQAYLKENPEVAKAAYYATHEISSDYETERTRINKQQLVEEMETERKATLLLNEWISDKLKGKDLAAFPSVEDVKEYYRLQSKLKTVRGVKEFDGYPHMILPEQPVAMKLIGGDESTEKALRYYFPSQGRVLISQETASLMIAMLKPSAQSNGKVVKLFLPGEVNADPGKDECQIILVPPREDLQEKLDWRMVAQYAQIWEDKKVATFGWPPELVAAIYVFKGFSPQEACTVSGLLEPDKAFLGELAKYSPNHDADIGLDPQSDEDPDRAL